MGKRRKSRELAVKVLFHIEYNHDNPKEAFDLIFERFSQGKLSISFSKGLVFGVCENKKTLDKVISQASRNWKITRMSQVDKCILRIAIFEILFMEDIPPRVSIDEAVELGKKYGSEDSSRFINGVLDKIYKFQEKESEPDLKLSANSVKLLLRGP